MEINSIYVDDITASQIPSIQDAVLKKDRDKVICIDGREGCGKSTLALQLATAIDVNGFNIEKIAFSADSFIKLVKSTERKKGDCIVLDEAFMAASSRGVLSHVNKAMMGLATEMRQLNLIVIIVLPSFFDLDKYFAIWRCDTLFHTYFDKKGQRGRYMIFPFEKKKKLYINGKKNYSYGIVKCPYPPQRFNKGYGLIDETEYRLRKQKAFRKRDLSIWEKRWRDRCVIMIRALHDVYKETDVIIADRLGMKMQLVEVLRTRGVTG